MKNLKKIEFPCGASGTADFGMPPKLAPDPPNFQTTWGEEHSGQLFGAPQTRSRPLKFAISWRSPNDLGGRNIQVTCLVPPKPAPDSPKLPSRRSDLATWGRRAFQVTCLVPPKPAPDTPNLPSRRSDLATWGRRAFPVTCLVPSKPAPNIPNLPSCKCPSDLGGKSKRSLAWCRCRD